MSAEQPTRRDLLDKALSAGVVIWCGGVIIPASVYLWPARAGGPGEEYAKAGSPADFEVGTERMVNRKGKPVMVLRLKEDEFRAYSAVCPHLGCVVRWDRASKRIACPCHAGFFGTDGRVISGPPPQDLTPHKVVVAGDEVRVY